MSLRMSSLLTTTNLNSAEIIIILFMMNNFTMSCMITSTLVQVQDYLVEKIVLGTIVKEIVLRIMNGVELIAVLHVQIIRLPDTAPTIQVFVVTLVSGQNSAAQLFPCMGEKMDNQNCY